MRFRVGRETLGEAVAWVARALPARPVVPVLSGLLLEAGSAGLTLSCFDYEVAARVQIDADVDEAGSALVPGRLLAEITRSLPGRPAEFSSDGEMVSLACGSAEFTLVALPIADYPALPEPPLPAGAVEGAAFATAASQVVPAASRDDTLPMLTAVCLDVDGETLTLAATDRYRLAVRELRWTPAAPGIRAVAMVPARTLADVARTMAPGVPVTVAFGVSQPGAGGTGPASSLAATSQDALQRGTGLAEQPGLPGRSREPRPADGMISFEAGGRRLIARLIAGEFIRYRSRFPAEFGCRAELPAGPFTEAVRRVSLVAERASPVRLAFSSGNVVIEAQAEGRARAVETVAAEFEGDERVISFNPHYLLDGLGAAAAGQARHASAAADDGATAPARASGPAEASVTPDGSDQPPSEAGRIRLEFTSPAKPALITWSSGEMSERTQDGGASGTGTGSAAFRYLLVPLRVPART
jgi:DNA polymerase-3 subunit beta